MTEFKVGDRVLYKEDGDIGVISAKRHLYTIDFPECTANIPGEDLEAFESELAQGPSSAVSLPDIQAVSDLADRLELSPSFEDNVRRITSDIAKLLIEKNKAYGDSALNPVRVFSSASRIEQLNVRIDDKISRIQRGTDYEDEDTVRDLIGYLVLRLIAEESE